MVTRTKRRKSDCALVTQGAPGERGGHGPRREEECGDSQELMTRVPELAGNPQRLA